MSRLTWESQINIEDPAAVLATLRQAGLPLAESGADLVEEESTNSRIVAIMAPAGDTIHAIVATPSGFVYRFEPPEIDIEFWSFALRHYYVVTGNMADRLLLAKQADVDIKGVTGRAMDRKKTDAPSGLLLDEMLAILAKRTTSLAGS